MDRITESLLRDFNAAFDLRSLTEQDLFEHFANYCVVSQEFGDSFELDDVSIGGSHDTGIDGLAILVNGCLVITPDEVVELLRINKYLDVRFVFIQAKRSSNFKSSEIGNFLFGVKDFFTDEPQLPRNESLDSMAHVQAAIYDHAVSFRHGNPTCSLYYVTTGKWTGEAEPSARIASERGDLLSTGLFREVHFIPVGANELQSFYRRTKNRVTATIEFPNRTVLPQINGVDEAYLGLLTASQYLKLITDEVGNIRKALFYDNVRDFQNYNEVNIDISETLKSSNKDRFAVLNNGVTIVAKTLRVTGNEFRLEDYQIVNGCQTSHVIYDERNQIDDTVYIPVRIIHTSDDDVTNAVIRATNRQTVVKTEDLQALTEFQKRLEQYFASFEGRKRLYYERRSKQYADVGGIEKVRIISRSVLIRAFASMFLAEPHRASAYYATLLRLLGGKIFSDDHKLEPYYVSAVAYYRLEYFFRNNQLDGYYRPARYHLLMAVRHLLAPGRLPSLSANQIVELCNNMIEVLWDDSKAIEIFGESCLLIDEAALGEEWGRARVKTQGFTDQMIRVLTKST